jgi:predicted phosphoribosyltransferase
MLELARRERAIQGDRPRPQIRNREIILVDDGLATGSTMYAANINTRKASLWQCRLQPAKRATNSETQ